MDPGLSNAITPHKQKTASVNGTYHRRENHLETVDSSQTKVGEFDLTWPCYQDVLWLEVTVDDAMRVYEIDAI